MELSPGNDQGHRTAFDSWNRTLASANKIAAAAAQLERTMPAAHVAAIAADIAKAASQATKLSSAVKHLRLQPVLAANLLPQLPTLTVYSPSVLKLIDGDTALTKQLQAQRKVIEQLTGPMSAIQQMLGTNSSFAVLIKHVNQQHKLLDQLVGRSMLLGAGNLLPMYGSTITMLSTSAFSRQLLQVAKLLEKERKQLHELASCAARIAEVQPSTGIERFLLAIAHRIHNLDQLISEMELRTLAVNVPEDVDEGVATLRRNFLDAEELLELILEQDDVELQVIGQAYMRTWLDARILCDRVGVLEGHASVLFEKLLKN